MTRRAIIITDTPDQIGKPIITNIRADRITIHGDYLYVYLTVDEELAVNDELVAMYRESEVRAAYITETNGAKVEPIGKNQMSMRED